MFDGSALIDCAELAGMGLHLLSRFEQGRDVAETCGACVGHPRFAHAGRTEAETGITERLSGRAVLSENLQLSATEGVVPSGWVSPFCAGGCPEIQHAAENLAYGYANGRWGQPV